MANVWSLADGANCWNFAEEARVPAIADPITMSVGETRWLTGDFGNLKELNEGGEDIASVAVAIAPSSGVTISGREDGDYYSGAWFTATTGGEYVVTWTATLTGGAVIPRMAKLVVE